MVGKDAGHGSFLGSFTLQCNIAGLVAFARHLRHSIYGDLTCRSNQFDDLGMPLSCRHNKPF